MSSRLIKTDSSGMVSLEIGDYAGLSRMSIENQLASLPYEVSAFFDDGGNLIAINSGGDAGSAAYAGAAMGAVAYARDHPGYTGSLTSFHNHPLGDGGVGIFSDADIATYAASADAIRKGYRGYASNNTVKTVDGRSYSLEYVGGGRRKLENFSSAYRGALVYGSREANRANRDRVRLGGNPMSDREFAGVIDGVVANWLSENASKYGFRFSAGRWK